MALLDIFKKFLSFLRKQESRKVKGATLIESLVASVIIVIIFTIASLTLNNVFQSTVKNNTSRVQHRMNELEYLFINDKLTYPYQEDFEDWSVQLVQVKESQGTYLTLQAKRPQATKSISRKLVYVSE